MRNYLAFLSVTLFAACQSTPMSTDCAASGTCVPDDAAVLPPSPDLAPFSCSPACTQPTPYCNSAHNCVVCLTDDNCPAGQLCQSSGTGASCVPGCADDARCRAGGAALSCCGMQCVDTTSDDANCGACATACAPAHASGQCAASTCTLMSCTSGYGDCDKDPSNGCETSLHVDPANCGGCGMACTFPNGLAGCADTCYLRGCQFGYDDCDGNEMNGCELNVQSDPNNCGACKATCNTAPNASGQCINAGCVLTCNPGFSDCDGNEQNGCELPTSADNNNCGGCGKVCAQGLVCVNSSCTCPNCQLANAKTECVNNQCVLASCFPGYADCDGNPANGCEVNIASDSKNCNGCGNACMGNLVCNNAMCTVQTCLNNPQWMQVNCMNPSWDWSSDRTKAMDRATANSLHILQSNNYQNGVCSVLGTGWVSTQTFVIANCNNLWYHLGGSYTGNCGGHDGELYRHLVLGQNDCYAY